MTVLQAGPCVVVQKKTPEREGYSAVQLGLVEEKPAKVNKPLEGHFRKAAVNAARVLKEFRLLDGSEDVAVGDEVRVGAIFQPDDRVDVSGRAIGRGFQGVVKRHGFRGGRATHGSMFHRAPGSIGCSATPSRVFKNKKMPGHLGVDRVTTLNLKVVQTDVERGLILVEGAVPGAKGGLYCWEHARHVAEVILVEGLFDYASLWQAGFHNVTCAMGTHLNGRQFRQLCDRPRTVYLAFDADTNGSGQSAAQSLACRLREQGLNVRIVLLPDGHDPNSFFLQGGDAGQFRRRGSTRAGHDARNVRAVAGSVTAYTGNAIAQIRVRVIDAGIDQGHLHALSSQAEVIAVGD